MLVLMMIKLSSEASEVRGCRLCDDECLIVSGEISDISGAETDNISFIRGRGKV